MVKMLKSESSDRHWRINGMIDDVKCMQDTYFVLKKRVELLQVYGMIKDEEDTCPELPPDIADALDNIQNCLEDVKETLEEVEGFHHPCGGTGWRQVAYIDTNDPNYVCPADWQKQPFDPEGILTREACIPPNAAVGICDITSFSVSEPYSQVCGRAEGYCLGDIGGFRQYYADPTAVTSVTDFFASGLILSRGTEHIWSFIAGTPPGDFFDTSSGTGENKCPCLTGEETFIATHGELPDFVGRDYFCESGSAAIFNVIVPNFFDFPLWDGLGCSDGSQCCNDGTPPVFTKTLSSASMDTIDARMCIEDAVSSGVVAITYLEIYVR